MNQKNQQDKQDDALLEKQRIQQEEQDKIEKQKLIDGQLSTKETTCYCAQLVITIILVVALFQDHRIQDGYQIVEGLDDFIGISNLTEQSLMSFNSLFTNKISVAIKNIYNSKNKNLTLTYNPQQHNTLQSILDAQPNYQESQYRIQFLRTFNLFLGMRIRIDLRTIDDNEFVSNFFQVLSQNQILLIEPGGYQDQAAKLQIILQSNQDNLIQTDNYIDMFFTSELDVGVVNNLLEFIQIQLSDIKTYQVTIDVFSVNLIRQMIVQQTRVFTESDQGALNYYQQDQVAIFLNIKGNTSPANTLYASYLIKIFYLCCVSLQILISFVLKVLGMIVNFITTKIFIFDKFLIINLILQSVVVSYLSTWLQLFSTYNSLNQSTFQSFSDFDHYANYMSAYNGDRFFSIIVLTIQTIALVQLINQKIPSFNIIYYSLLNSSRDLFLLMIFIVIMLVAFSVVGTIIFSATQISFYSEITGTLFELFKFIFQYGVLEELVNINTGTGIVFGLIFILFFNFILIPYLYSVIIVNYNSIREAMSITTEAITAIESEKQFQFLIKIFNLITFASPQQVMQQKQKDEEKKKQIKEKDKQSLENLSVHDKQSPDKRIKGGFQSHIDPNYSYSVNSPRKNRLGNETPVTPEKAKSSFQKNTSMRGSQIFDDAHSSTSRKNSRSQTMINFGKKNNQIQVHGNSQEYGNTQQGPEVKMKWKQQLQFNFKQLGLNFYGFIPAKVEVQTRQQRQDEIVQKIEQLKFEKKKEKISIQKKRAKTARENIKLTIIHIYFLIVLIFMGSEQLLYDQCYKINKAIDNYYRNTQITVLQGLVSQQITFDTVSEINHLYAWIEYVFLPPLTPQFSTNSYSDRIDQYNLIFAEFPARMTIRRTVMHQNSDFQFYNTTSNKMNDLPLYIQTAGDMSPSSGYSDEYQQDFYGPITLNEYYYIRPGPKTTPYQEGGFVQYFTTKQTQNYLYLLTIYRDQIINHDTGTVVLECIFYNKFDDLYSYAIINFDITTSGYINKKISVNSFIVDLYSSDRLTRIVWEVLFFIQILIYFLQFKRDFSAIFMNEEMKALTPLDPELEKKNYVLYLLNYHIEEGEYSLVGLVKQFLTRTLKLAQRILMSLQIYCQQTTANIFLILGQILALIVIIFYLTYACNTDRINFDRNKSANSYQLIGQFSDFASQMGKYSAVMSILMFVQFMRILFYFGFSGKLALVLDVISNANLDVFFFLIIFFILLSAFGLISIVLFGSEISQFQDFPNCIIELLSWLSGVQSFPSENFSASATEYIFYIIFLIIMQLILLRMFIAILDGYFIQKISDKDDQTKGIIDLLLDLLHTYYEQIRNNSQEKQQDEVEEQEKTNKGIAFIKKAKDCLWRYFNKGLLFFLQIYFSDEETEKLEKRIGLQTQQEEAIKLEINFQENDESEQNISQQTINDKLLDLQTYMKEKHNDKDTQKDILDKKDKSSINFWMMLLSDSLQTTTNKQLNFTEYDKKGNILYLNEYRQIEYKMENYQNGVQTIINLPDDEENIMQSPGKNVKDNTTKFSSKISRVQTNMIGNQARKSVLILDENEKPLIKYGKKQIKKDIEQMKKRNRNIHIEYNQEWRSLFDSKIMNEIIESLSGKVYLYEVKNKKNKLFVEEISNLIETWNFDGLLNSIYRTAEYIILSKSKKKNEFKLISHLFYCLLYFFYNLKCVQFDQEKNQKININKIIDFDPFDDDKEIQEAQFNLSARDVSTYLNNVDQQQDYGITYQNIQNTPQNQNMSFEMINIQKEQKPAHISNPQTSQLKKREGKVGVIMSLNDANSKHKLPQKTQKALSQIELLKVFKRCELLFSLWKQTSLSDKVHLWFGSDFINPYLPHYLKSILWHNSNFLKETFYPFQKQCDFDLDKFIQGPEVSSYEIQNLWLYFDNYVPPQAQGVVNDEEKKEKQQNNQKNASGEANQKDNINQEIKPLIDLKKKLQMEENGDLDTFQINEIKEMHLLFIQMFVRDETDRVGVLYKKDTMQEKYNFLKSYKKVKNDHKMVIFHLMTLEEKMRLTFLNMDDVVSKFEFLMIIEESYESVMNIIKLDKDLNDEMRQWIFDFYYNFAQYNSYHTAYKVKKQFQAYTEKSEDVFQYIRDLERTIIRLDQLIEDNIKILKQYI
ncbi:cation channel family transporter (macronuclear) [Tetrahymena thermophila SB210]|uniref:Cation channel family transporter n=1 Tax=Tetrahymena thermophila (strain SB210) TaxID=312017 RepID=I7MLN1_TETTS|nr:cation channel family transporter [Tetrahymena thermophila SB210]EAS02738.2 cation channel family transporter [Tetrahymena thermophila SB210]|eukprot:XP_001022983.2 cation channel family transporter [Tetrahymena thermophila SB210]